MRGKRHAEGVIVAISVDTRRDHMARSPIGVLRLVIIKDACIGDDLGHGQGAITHHRHSQFASRDVLLDQRRAAEPP